MASYELPAASVLLDISGQVRMRVFNERTDQFAQVFERVKPAFSAAAVF